MRVKDIILHRGVSFEDYGRLPGISHSDIRNEGKTPFTSTPKMNLGTNVHDYLLTPERYNHSNIEVVKPIAMKLKEALGDLWRFLEPELAVTATFCHEEFEMKYRGRIDLGIPKKIVIDLKIINGKTVRDTIQFFNYDTQLPGYALGIEAPRAMILAYSTKTKETEIVNIPVVTGWWETQVLMRGEPILT